MITRRGRLLDRAVRDLRTTGTTVPAPASAELRHLPGPEAELPVALKVASLRPGRDEPWPHYKERVGDELGRVRQRLAATVGLGWAQDLYAANSLATSLTPQQLDEVGADPDVSLELVELDPLVPLVHLDDAVVDIGLPDVRVAHPTLTGGGVRVAVIDTGIDAHHPALRVADAVSTSGEDVSIPGAHGTHCAGSVASRDDTYTGVAPDVELIDVKALRANGTGRHTYITRGVDEALDRQADVLSLSLGFNHLPVDTPGGHGWSCPDGRCPLCFAVDTAVADGAVVVVAAGNEHERSQSLRLGGRGLEYDTELGCPGQARGAITVGSHHKASYAPAWTSSVGPTAWGAPKPDLLAPGVDVISTIPVPRDGAGAPVPGAPRYLRFGAMSGTSMATPIVAGACALLIQAARAAQAPPDPGAIRAALLAEHVEHVGGPPNVVGAGRLRLRPRSRDVRSPGPGLAAGGSGHGGGMTDRQAEGQASPEHVHHRADHLLPEEARVGSDDAEGQAQVILEESEARTTDRNAAPDTVVEHRQSDETVGYPEEPE